MVGGVISMSFWQSGRPAGVVHRAVRPRPEAEKMLRRLSAGASANSHSLKHAAAPAAMLAFSVLPTEGLTALWTTPAGLLN